MSARKMSETQSDDGSSVPVLQPIKIPKSSDDTDKKSANKRLKDAEVCVPIVYGTTAFYLGRKASESQSHRWTVYVRGATNEDLGVVLKRVVFQLHPSFNNPTRVVESAPFELTECGWGEFEIAISLIFHSEICDKQVDLYHNLKLYPEEESGPQSTKKPVVMETYNEIVFPDPSEGFLARVQNHPALVLPRLPAGFTLPSPVPNERSNEKQLKDHPLAQWFLNFSEADELLKLAAARQQVQAHIVKLRRQLNVMDGPPQYLVDDNEMGAISSKKTFNLEYSSGLDFGSNLKLAEKEGPNSDKKHHHVIEIGIGMYYRISPPSILTSFIASAKPV